MILLCVIVKNTVCRKKQYDSYLSLFPLEQKIDFNSCIRFIETWKEEIDPEIYYSYNKNMLRLAVKWEAGPEIIEYYREEMLTYVEYLSFEQFLFGFTSLDKKQLERIKERYVERIRKVEID